MGSFCGVKPLSVPGPLSLLPPRKESSHVSPAPCVLSQPGWLGCVLSGRPLRVASAWPASTWRGKEAGAKEEEPEGENPFVWEDVFPHFHGLHWLHPRASYLCSRLDGQDAPSLRHPNVTAHHPSSPLSGPSPQRSAGSGWWFLGE